MTQKVQDIALILKDLAFPILVGVVLYFGSQYLNRVDRIETLLYEIKVDGAAVKAKLENIDKDNSRQDKELDDLKERQGKRF